MGKNVWGRIGEECMGKDRGRMYEEG